MRVCVQEEKKLDYFPKTVSTARKLNRKWEESSAATTGCSSSRCLPGPSPREDCQDRETSVQAYSQYPSPLFIERKIYARKKDSAEAVILYCRVVYNFT